jgi:predicted transcriptional regulator
MLRPLVTAYPDEVLRSVADRMAAHGIGVIPVVDRDDSHRIDGLVTQFDLLEARQKLLQEERHAERVLTLRRVSGDGRPRGAAGRVPENGREAETEAPVPETASASTEAASGREQASGA